MFFFSACTEPAQLHLIFGKFKEFPLLSLFSITQIILETFNQEQAPPNTRKPCPALSSASC